VHELLAEWGQVLEEGLEAVVRSGDASPLMQDRRLLTCAYFIDAGRLVETRRLARLEERTPAQESALNLLRGAIAFLSRLREKTGG
jgi:hypothetical protein